MSGHTYQHKHHGPVSTYIPAASNNLVHVADTFPQNVSLVPGIDNIKGNSINIWKILKMLPNKSLTGKGDVMLGFEARGVLRLMVMRAQQASCGIALGAEPSGGKAVCSGPLVQLRRNGHQMPDPGKKRQFREKLKGDLKSNSY